MEAVNPNDPRQPRGSAHQGGAGTTSPADSILQFAKVTSSTISPVTKALQYTVAGIAGMTLEDGVTSLDFGDEDGEVTNDADVFCGLGIIGRPLPPDTREGRDEHLEVICIRDDDALVPIAARDVRLRMGGDAPTEGVTALVGYGGGFHSLTPVEAGSQPDGGGTIHVLYCPYDFDANGIAQKAHAITLDPTAGNESLVVAHADGASITIDSDNLILKSPTGASWIGIADDGIVITAPQVTMQAAVVIGDATLAVPLLAGAASPPCSSLLVSP